MFNSLKPGGLLYINHSSPIQIGYGYWYLQFMPESREKIMERYPPHGWMLDNLQNVGFIGKSLRSSHGEHNKTVPHPDDVQSVRNFGINTTFLHFPSEYS